MRAPGDDSLSPTGNGVPGETMTKAVFTTKSVSSYDDLPEVRYHFPKTYLNQVERAVGDWILYYEPRRSSTDPASRGGAQVYFATARLLGVVSDPARPDHFYAEVDNFLPFTRPVPFREGGHYFESGLEKADGSTNKGAFGRAVRNLSDSEYDLIWAAGFGHILGAEPRPRPAPDVPEAPLEPMRGFAEEQAPFVFDEPLEQDRRIIQQLTSRPFRDRAFAAAVKDAYLDTCAMSGVKIINGGGRSEVQAAHIRPFAHHGPDSIRNGLALSGTFHWMFDRGLVSVDDDYKLLLAKDRLPDAIDRLLGGNDRLLIPNRPDFRPHPRFLAWHRNNVFKG